MSESSDEITPLDDGDERGARDPRRKEPSGVTDEQGDEPAEMNMPSTDAGGVPGGGIGTGGPGSTGGRG